MLKRGWYHIVIPTSFLKVTSYFSSLNPASWPVDRSRFSLGIPVAIVVPFLLRFRRLRKQVAKVRSPKSARRPVRPHGYFHFPVPQATLSFRFSNIQDTLVGTSLIFLLKLFRRIDFRLRAVLLFRETDWHSLRSQYPIDSWHLRNSTTAVTTEFLQCNGGSRCRTERFEPTKQA